MTDLRKIAEDAFRQYNLYPGEGFRNHCRRIHQFALLHAEHLGTRPDTDLLFLAAMFHDLGLLVRPRPGTDYLDRTLEQLRKALAGEDLEETTWQLLEECILYNHALTGRLDLLPEAEAFRRAVFTEHSHGLIRHGLSRASTREVFRRFPRDNFSRVLADFFWRTVVFEPTTIPAIFRPRRRT